MASFIPALNTLRVALEFSQVGHVMVNVYHVKKDTPIVSADLTAIAEAFLDWWVDDQRGLFSNEVALSMISVRDLTSETGEVLELTSGMPVAGGDTNDPVPNSSALVMSYRTGVAGRSYRGRSYLGGLSKSVIDSPNTIYATNLTTLLLNQLALETRINGEGFTWVVASFKNAGVPRTSAVLTPITEITANTKLDVQRRRMKGAV